MYKGSDELTLYQSCVHAPVNGGPVFPGTILGYIYKLALPGVMIIKI